MVNLLEPWRYVFRTGILPQLSNDMLFALKKALEEDDSRLIQGATTKPPPLLCVSDWPCEGACALGFPYMATNDGAIVGDTEEWFAKTCYESDNAVGESGSIRYFLNWFDETPRDQMRNELLQEVSGSLATRGL